MRRFLSTLLCCFIASSINQSINAQSNEPYWPSSGLPPVLTGISGCTNQSPTQTVNCPRPVILTLTGSGFMTGIEYESYPSVRMAVLLSFPDEPIASSYYCSISLIDTVNPINDTYVTCTIPDTGYGTHVGGVMLDVFFLNHFTSKSSSLSNAVSFAVETAPRVDRVSGCRVVSSDGRSVSQCDIMNDQITLHGSGFMSVDHSYSILTLGSARRQLFMFSDNSFIIRYTDNQIVLSFATSSMFVPDEAMSGRALLLTLESAVNIALWSTEPVYVSFNALPPPVIRGVVKSSWTQGCLIDNSTGVDKFRDCIAGMSQLVVSGDNFYAGLSVYVGDRECRILPGTASSVVVYMPVFRFIEGHFYDMTIKTISGTFTLPSLIEFNTDPVITSIVPCIDVGIPFYQGVTPHCRPTETMTLKVLNFKRSDLPRVWFRNLQNSNQIVECPQVTMPDMETVTCVVPPSPGTTWYFALIYIEWQDGLRTSEVQVSELWEQIDAPRITSLSGCYSDSNDGLHLNQCLGQPSNGVVLTIHGIRLASAGKSSWTVWINQVTECYHPEVVNNQTVTCLLPNVADTTNQLVFNTRYPVRIQGYINGAWTGSNAGYITFVQSETRPSTSSSSTSATTIALATVFSIVGAILLAGCLFMVCRKNMSKQPFMGRNNHESEFVSESGSAGKHVELAEVE